MWFRVTVHVRPKEYLSNTDARANVVAEFEVSDDSVGAVEATNKAADAVDRAIEKLRLATLRKEAQLARGN